MPSTERVALRRAVGLLRLDRRRLAGAVLAGAVGLASGVALTACAAWLIARASQMPPVLTLSVAAVAVRLFGISRAVLRYVERLASHDVALAGMASLRENVYSRLADGRTDAVTALRRGDLLARTGADVDAVGDVVVRALVPGAVAAVVGAGSVLLVGWLDVGVGAVLAACLALAGIAGPALTMRAARLSERAELLARSEIAATAMTMIDGAGELTVSGRLLPMTAELRRAEADLARAKDVAARPAALAAGIDTLAMGLAVLGALLIGVPATVAGTMAPVALAVVVLTPLAAFEGTALLGPAARQLVRSGGAAARIMALLDSAAAVDAGPASQPVAARSAGAGPAPIGVHPASIDVGPASTGDTTARLRARGVAVRWPSGPVVAAGIDLDAAPGRAVAVVGASGSGKTTLLLTLAGLLPTAAGELTLDGRALWGQDRAAVSDQVVLTAEDAHVFETTVLENLRVARGDVTRAEATSLLARAELGPWLAGLPDGIDTMLGSNATTISGGERRRLLLARALASRAPLLLLDEPAEHLDRGAADRLVADLIRTAHTHATDGGPHRRGIVLVTHRLAALAEADEVILIGRAPSPAPAAGAAPSPGAVPSPGADLPTVLARGTHEHLLATVAEYRWAADQEQAAATR
ncbi:thiol reductant ABC exporter subunit CydC [Pengzhenrongella sicca]|uniref:Thiol reductant ABC exporter subunit CydC n=1 Tax=Pengzhenrongella sicca TaxID=2819238 RepID=A0A8A4ZLM3_9MICO|nr:thiol reductant ABC exporter subunit CydC [Pengzhenrongella sicca]